MPGTEDGEFRESICAVVVTYNRKELLADCLTSLINQSRQPDKVLVVDNLSSDNTREYLETLRSCHSDQIELLLLDENIGGSGGFHEGLKRAMQDGYDWYWLMDDDARVDAKALEELLLVKRERSNVYASVAINQSGNDEWLCWPAVVSECETIAARKDLGNIQEVFHLPFLGFLVHHDTVENLGLPDRDYFILGDDTEYVERIKHAGGRLFLARESVLHHPMPERRIFRFMGRTFSNLVVSPWKKYYDVRNRVFIAKKYYGIKCWTKTIPGQLVRMFHSAISGPDRSRIIYVYLKGIFDGIVGRKGRVLKPD